MCQRWFSWFILWRVNMFNNVIPLCYTKIIIFWWKCMKFHPYGVSLRPLFSWAICFIKRQKVSSSTFFKRSIIISILPSFNIIKVVTLNLKKIVRIVNIINLRFFCYWIKVVSVEMINSFEMSLYRNQSPTWTIT